MDCYDKIERYGFQFIHSIYSKTMKLEWPDFLDLVKVYDILTYFVCLCIFFTYHLKYSKCQSEGER